MKEEVENGSENLKSESNLIDVNTEGDCGKESKCISTETDENGRNQVLFVEKTGTSPNLTARCENLTKDHASPGFIMEVDTKCGDETDPTIPQKPVFKINNSKMCSSEWDNDYCWPYTPSNHLFVQQCPVSLNLMRQEETDKYYYTSRVCGAEGKWERGNFSSCQELIHIWHRKLQCVQKVWSKN